MKLTPEEQVLVDRLKELRPDLVVVPRQASAIMALRGMQASSVFYSHENGFDVVADYIHTSDVPPIEGISDGSGDLDVDERQMLVVARAFEGCIEGMEEWMRRRQKEGDSTMVTSWERPFTLTDEQKLR